MMRMLTLFVEGGSWFMAVLTVLLVAIFFAAWKAPRWVMDLGRLALVFGFFGLVLGLRQMFDYIQHVETMVSHNILCGGLKVALISVLYGMIIYMVAAVINLIQKPRL